MWYSIIMHDILLYFIDTRHRYTFKLFYYSFSVSFLCHAVKNDLHDIHVIHLWHFSRSSTVFLLEVQAWCYCALN
jgi:hypothetical protein